MIFRIDLSNFRILFFCAAEKRKIFDAKDLAPAPSDSPRDFIAPEPSDSHRDFIAPEPSDSPQDYIACGAPTDSSKHYQTSPLTSPKQNTTLSPKEPFSSLNNDQISSKAKVLSPRDHFMQNNKIEIGPISSVDKINDLDHDSEIVNENHYPIANDAPIPNEITPHNKLQGA